MKLILASLDNGQKANDLQIITDPTEIETLLSTKPQLHYKALKDSEPISERTARYTHIKYLQSNKVIKTASQNVAHSLMINRDNLETLYKHGLGGIRLYFCIDKDGNGIDFLSVIAVPRAEDGSNILSVGNQTTIINKLDPCPEKCVEDISTVTGPQNHESDLNYDRYNDYGAEGYWFKPNFKGGAAWVSKENVPRQL